MGEQGVTVALVDLASQRTLLDTVLRVVREKGGTGRGGVTAILYCDVSRSAHTADLTDLNSVRSVAREISLDHGGTR